MTLQLMATLYLLKMARNTLSVSSFTSYGDHLFGVNPTGRPRPPLDAADYTGAKAELMKHVKHLVVYPRHSNSKIGSGIPPIVKDGRQNA
jgi:hypothetical protein